MTDPASQAAGIAWWEELTGRGGEGMVVKPLTFIHRGSRGLVPARREVPGAGVPADHLRPRLHDRGEPRPGCGRGAWAGSGRWPSASSPWASRGWSGSCGGSRCGGSTSASSACWPWRASRWTRGSDPWRRDVWAGVGRRSGRGGSSDSPRSSATGTSSPPRSCCTPTRRSSPRSRSWITGSAAIEGRDRVSILALPQQCHVPAGEARGEPRRRLADRGAAQLALR